MACYFLVDKKLKRIKAIANRPFVISESQTDQYAVVAYDSCPYMNVNLYKVSVDENGEVDIIPFTEDEVNAYYVAEYNRKKHQLLIDLNRALMTYITQQLSDWGSSYTEILAELQNTSQVQKIYLLGRLKAYDANVTETTISSLFLQCNDAQSLQPFEDYLTSINCSDTTIIDHFKKGAEAALLQYWIETLWNWCELQEENIRNLQYPTNLPTDIVDKLYQGLGIDTMPSKPNLSFLG
jgi:hypothetical protein